MPKKLSTKRKSPRYLLVEGKDDEHVLWSLFEYNKLPETFEIEDGKGIATILEGLPARVIEANVSVFGLVVDADTDIIARWQRLRDRLTSHYPNFPTNPDQHGTIVEAVGRPKLGIWLMPDNRLPGMLEDFVAYLVPDPTTDMLWQLSEKCLQEARSLNPAIPAAKGRIHTYLAWQPEPGTPLGLSITKKYLNPTKPEATVFIDWITRLFS